MRRAAPWYLHPLQDPSAWDRLRTGSVGLDFAVVNVANGPGDAVDACYRDALVGVRTPLIGYVDVAYGRRERAAILRDVDAWREYYGVTGVMLDQVPTRMQGRWRPSLIDRIRAAGTSFVVANPGCATPGSLLRRADVTCVSELDWAAYARLLPDPAPAGPERIWHLIHSCPVDQQPAAVALAGARGAGFCWATAGTLPNPWQVLQEVW